jgi:O-antigen ligase
MADPSTARFPLASNFSLDLPSVAETPTLGQRFLRLCVIPLMLISILAPVVRLGDAFWLKLDQLALPVIALVYLWLLLAGLARPIPLNSMFLVAFVFCICIALSLLYGSQVIGHPLMSRDFMEFPKTVFPVIFFTLAYVADLPEKTLRSLVTWLVVAVLLICAYAYGQWFNMGFTYYLQPFYSGGAHDEGSLEHYRRVYSTLSNPNTLAILMTWVIAAFTMAALFRVGRRFWVLTALFGSLITLTMTGSRYGLIDTVFALILVFLLPAPTEKAKLKRRGVLFVAIPLVLGAIFVVAATNRATLDRFQMLGSPLKENSLRARLDSLWLDAFGKFLQSPVFGHGPARVIFTEVVTDCEYLQILKQFGIVGLLPYLCYFLVPLAAMRKGMKSVALAGAQLEGQWRGTYWGLCFGWVVPVTCLVMNIGMGTYYDQSLVAFTWMSMGIGASCSNRVAQLAAPRISPVQFFAAVR